MKKKTTYELPSVASVHLSVYYSTLEIEVKDYSDPDAEEVRITLTDDQVRKLAEQATARMGQLDSDAIEKAEEALRKKNVQFLGGDQIG